MGDHERLMRQQDGLLTRQQALDSGLTANDVRRKLRRREWQRVHPGVYLNHTGPLTWKQRAWAGCLYAAPAALTHDSALRWLNRESWHVIDDEVIHVAVERNRHLIVPSGIRLHRLGQYDAKFLDGLSPARMRPEHALIDKAAVVRDEAEIVHTLSTAVQGGITTIPRLRAALAARSRIARRRTLHAILNDLETGAWSVLEHGYLVYVERPHGLPTGQRQVRQSTTHGIVYRDVMYEEASVAVELDGRTNHLLARQRADDLARDLDAATAGLASVRLGWAQVFTTPCATAYQLGLLMQRRGWSGSTHPCPLCTGSERSAA